MNDTELICEYAQCNSELAFAELVQRHINLVYSVAMRYVGNSHDAQDVTQAVFAILARKAAGLREKTVITGWLYETTRFTAISFVRSQIRRQTRENEAHMQSTLNDSNPDAVWQQIAPLLEDGMNRLNEAERTLLALHFFENKSGAETAAALGIEEWAARKRITRAVEKLRKFFTKRDITISAVAIAGLISANSVQAAPAGLAVTISAATTKGAALSTSTLALVKGTLKFMAWAKAKTAIAIGAAVVLTTGTGVLVTEMITHDDGSAKTLMKFDWQKLMDEGHLEGGEIVRMDGSTVLKMVGTNELGIGMRLLTVTNPPITEMNYAIVGEMKYDVELVGNIGMWNLFPPLEPGDQLVPYSSHIGSLVGPSPTIHASSDWREFSLPLDRTGKSDPDIDPAVTAKPPERLEVSIHCPGLGTVYLRNVKLIQWKALPQLASSDSERQVQN